MFEEENQKKPEVVLPRAVPCKPQQERKVTRKKKQQSHSYSTRSAAEQVEWDQSLEVIYKTL